MSGVALAYAMVRHRFAGFAGTFITLALGVTVVTVGTTLWVSARPEMPQVYAQAEVLVRSPAVADNDDGYPEYRPWSPGEVDELTGRLAGISGVAAAVPHRSFYVQRMVDGRPAGDANESLAAGLAWSTVELGTHRLKDGVPPQRAGTVAVDERLGLALGAPLAVVTAEGPATWTVSGVLTGGPDNGTGFAYFVADGTARHLASGVRVIGLRLAPGADPAAVAATARAAVGDGSVLRGGERDSLEPEHVTRVRWLGAQLIIAMVFLGGFTAVFVVASTSAFSASLRRREVGLLRAAGATPGQVRRMMYGEAVLVATGAGVAGTALGAAVAPLVAGPFIAAGLEPPGFEVRLVPWAMLAAFGTGLVVALLGVWSSARRTSRVPPLAALRDAAVEKRPMTVPRWLGGSTFLLLGAGLVALVPSVPVEQKATTAMGSTMALIVAAALFAPIVVVPVVRLLTWPFREGAVGLLVREGSLVAVRRIASTAAPVLVTVGLAVLITGSFATYEEAAGLRGERDALTADVLATDNTPGLSEAAVRAVPGRSVLSTRVYGAGPDGVVKGIVAHGTSDAAGLVAPEEFGWAVGATVPLRFADGVVVPVRVQAVAPRTTDQGDEPAVTLPRALVRAHDPAALTPQVFLSGPATAGTPVGGVVLSARAYAERTVGEEADLVDLFLTVLLTMSVGYTGLAVGNTLILATTGRRGDFRTLRHGGATTAQTMRVAVVEAVLAAAIGTGLGLAVATTAMTGVARAVSDEIGAAVGIAFPWTTTVVVTLTCLAMTVACTAAPTRLALRRAP